MSEPAIGTGVRRLGAPVPILRSFDERHTRAFYLDILDFEVLSEHRFAQDAPLYMEVRRDDCVLHLSEHHGDATPGARLRIHTADVDALTAVLRAKEYPNARPGDGGPTPWGTGAVTLTDPFGNRLTFWQDAAP